MPVAAGREGQPRGPGRRSTRTCAKQSTHAHARAFVTLSASTLDPWASTYKWSVLSVRTILPLLKGRKSAQPYSNTLPAADISSRNGAPPHPLAEVYDGLDPCFIRRHNGGPQVAPPSPRSQQTRATFSKHTMSKGAFTNALALALAIPPLGSSGRPGLACRGRAAWQMGDQ